MHSHEHESRPLYGFTKHEVSSFEKKLEKMDKDEKKRKKELDSRLKKMVSSGKRKMRHLKTGMKKSAHKAYQEVVKGR